MTTEELAQKINERLGRQEFRLPMLLGSTTIDLTPAAWAIHARFEQMDNDGLMYLVDVGAYDQSGSWRFYVEAETVSEDHWKAALAVAAEVVAELAASQTPGSRSSHKTPTVGR